MGPKRYHDLKTHLVRRFGGPVAKIALDAGLSCPNRDGALSTRGCLFCDEDGSGSGSARRGWSITDQVQAALARVSAADPKKYIAYFQSFTNTYAPLAHLKTLWDQALSDPRIIGLSVGTRPDVVPDAVLDLLAEYALTRTVWLELGLQSASDRTLAKIHRGHTAAAFADAIRRAKIRGLEIVAHIILGLPGETGDDMIGTSRFLADLGVAGVKIHGLYVARGTALADLYGQGGYVPLTRDAFCRHVAEVLERLPASTVIHRLTGDPKPGQLVAPDWAAEKSKTLQAIRTYLEERQTWQGRLLGAPSPNPDRS